MKEKSLTMSLNRLLFCLTYQLTLSFHLYYCLMKQSSITMVRNWTSFVVRHVLGTPVNMDHLLLCFISVTFHVSVYRETVWVRWSLHEMSGEMVPPWDVSEQRNSLGEMVPPWDPWEPVWAGWPIPYPLSEHWKTDFWCQNHLGERFTVKIWILLWIWAQWTARVTQTSTVCPLKCCTPGRSGSVVFCEWTNLSHRVTVSSDPCYVWTNLCRMLWVCCAPWCWTNVWTFAVCHVSVDTQHVLWIYRSLLVYTWKQFSEETW